MISIMFLPLLLLSLLHATVASVTLYGDAFYVPDDHVADLPNTALQMCALSVRYLYVGKKPVPIAHVEIIAAMFEANGFATGSPVRFTDAQPLDPLLAATLSTEQIVFYAGYATLRAIMEPVVPESIDALDADVAALGFGDSELRTAIGGPFADAVAVLLRLDGWVSEDPWAGYNPRTPLRYPDCTILEDPGIFQPRCKLPCDTLPYSGLFNSTPAFNTLTGRNVDLEANFPPPLVYPGGDLPLVFAGDSAFAKDYQEVLYLNGQLTDSSKSLVELSCATMASNLVLLTAIYELVATNATMTHCLDVLLPTWVAIRDALIISKDLKMIFKSPRPDSIINCGTEGQVISAWRGPYNGIGEFVTGDDIHWQSYWPGKLAGVVPSYPSADIAASTAGLVMLERLMGPTMRGVTSFQVTEGASSVEPRILPGEEGYVEGVTDVPNQGSRSVGYSPATNQTFHWETFQELRSLTETSRVYTGLDTSTDIEYGILVGVQVADEVMVLIEHMNSMAGGQ